MDWEKIKAEYVAGGVSYKKLAERYGISRSVIERKGKAQGWARLRRAEDASDTIAIDSIRKKSIRIDEQYLTLVERLMKRADEVISSSTSWQATSIKEMATALKYIKECKGVRSDADVREQEARIAKLCREAQKENEDVRAIEVILDAGPAEWNE